MGSHFTKRPQVDILSPSDLAKKKKKKTNKIRKKRKKKTYIVPPMSDLNDYAKSSNNWMKQL